MEVEADKGWLRGARQAGLTLFGAGLGALAITVFMLVRSQSYIPALMIAGLAFFVIGFAMIVCPGRQKLDFDSLSKVPFGQLMRGLAPLERAVWVLALVVGLGAGLGVHYLFQLE